MAIVGRVVSAGIDKLRASCVDREDLLPGYGGFVKIPLNLEMEYFAVITELTISEDPLVQQIARMGEISEVLIGDNRINRIGPLVLTAQVVGYSDSGVIRQRLPSRPPKVLEVVETFEPAEIVRFCTSDSYNYLRHLVQYDERNRFDLLAAHMDWLEQVMSSAGQVGWKGAVMKRLNQLLQIDPECYLRLAEYTAKRV